MGAQVKLLMAPGEMSKLPAFLKKGGGVDIPLIKNFNVTEGGVWIDRTNRVLKIGYSFGGGGADGEFAYFLGKSICARFKVEKAGWDSVGYCRHIDEFIHGDPFCDMYFMFKRKKTLRVICRQITDYIAQLDWK